jgi:hypothetical protein
MVVYSPSVLIDATRQKQSKYEDRTPLGKLEQPGRCLNVGSWADERSCEAGMSAMQMGGADDIYRDFQL